MNRSLYVQVIPPLPTQNTFTYKLTIQQERCNIGSRVRIPVGNRTYIGVVYSISPDKPSTSYTLRDIIEVIDFSPIVSTKILDFWTWIANYYLCSLSDVFIAAMPSFTLKQNIISIDISDNIDYIGKINELSTEQSICLNNIIDLFNRKSVVLLKGVTASGKTEIYLHLILKNLCNKSNVLFLVPEIALTSQLTQRLKNVLGNILLVYHSRITESERKKVFATIINPKKNFVILGTRSAILLPYTSIGLIVIDEEHDISYKQSSPLPHYHARSCAIVLAQRMNGKVLLGSATPSVESFYNATIGKYGLVQLNERYYNTIPPKLTIIDLKRQYERKEMYDHFADPLVDKINSLLQKNRQIIIFQNRRGYAPQIVCTECGSTILCPHCNVPMTLHRVSTTYHMICHYCGYNSVSSDTCPHCKGKLKKIGMGTQKIEEEIIRLFPNATFKRMDFDTTRRKNGAEAIISAFSDKKIDILLGTQMITQGLDFDNVGLVAILNADNLLTQPDFRNHEYAMQRLLQVAGRAGRKNEQGEVFIQTWMPENQIFHWVKNSDYNGFYNIEIKDREIFKNPPFFRHIVISVRHSSSTKTNEAAKQLHMYLENVFSDRCSNIITPLINKIQDHYILQIRISVERSANAVRVNNLIRHSIIIVQSQYKTVRFYIDVDPM